MYGLGDGRCYKVTGGVNMTRVYRYLVFAGSAYYPVGGWDDLVGKYEYMNHAKDEAIRQRQDGLWVQLVDLTTYTEVDGEWRHI